MREVKKIQQDVDHPTWFGRRAVYTRVGKDIVKIDNGTHKRTVFTTIKVYEVKGKNITEKTKLAVCLYPDDVFKLNEERLRLRYKEELEVTRAMGNKFES